MRPFVWRVLDGDHGPDHIDAAYLQRPLEQPRDSSPPKFCRPARATGGSSGERYNAATRQSTSSYRSSIVARRAARDVVDTSSA